MQTRIWMKKSRVLRKRNCWAMKTKMYTYWRLNLDYLLTLYLGLFKSYLSWSCEKCHPVFVRKVDSFEGSHQIVLFLFDNTLYQLSILSKNDFIYSSCFVFQIWWNMRISTYKMNLMRCILFISNDGQCYIPIINHNYVIRDCFLHFFIKFPKIHCLFEYSFRSITFRITVNKY